VSDVLVLCYHAVSTTWPADLALAGEELRRQLEHLLARGYRGVRFHEAVVSPPPGRVLAVTFDDGYRSVLEQGLPILSALGLPGTVFAVTGFVERQEPLSWGGIDHWRRGPHAAELRGLSWDELAALADAGWEIGSHTRTHPRLTELDDSRLAEELVGSREDCERELGIPCRSLAYPYGDPNQRVVDAARAAGYAAAATLPGPKLPPSPDPHVYPREGIYRKDGRLRFELKISPLVRQLRATRAWRTLNRDPGVTAT
jgi:peptidoglycan/xylan/chitin deacetylase (PgdA/CDA1 family)